MANNKTKWGKGTAGNRGGAILDRKVREGLHQKLSFDQTPGRK